MCGKTNSAINVERTTSFTALRWHDYSKCEERWHKHESGFDSYPDARNKGFVGKSVCVRACLCTWMFVWGEFSQISKDIGCYNTLRCFHLTCVLSPEGLCNRRVVHSGLSAVAVRTTTQECVQNSVRSSEPSPPSPLLSSVRPPLMLWMLKHGWVRKRFVKGQTVVSTWYTNSPWCRPGPKLKAQFGLHRKWVVYLFDLIWGSSGTQQRQSTF
jgi:hypothetical protein